jgi:5-methylcytosine-specific restriction enzyme A
MTRPATGRREFPARVRLAAFQRAGGICEAPDCQTKLRPGDLYYDHIIPDALGGEPILANCQCLCKAHHDPKTATEDVPRIAAAKRQERKHIGIRKPATMPGSRNSRWKKRMDGTVERR